MKDNKKQTNIQRIEIIQETLMREIARLDDEDRMKREGKDEVARSNAISKASSTFINSENLLLKISRAKGKK